MNELPSMGLSSMERIHTMEDDDDEEDFELGVYGQGEANQDAANNRLCYRPVAEQ